MLLHDAFRASTKIQETGTLQMNDSERRATYYSDRSTMWVVLFATCVRDDAAWPLYYIAGKDETHIIFCGFSKIHHCDAIDRKWECLFRAIDDPLISNRKTSLLKT